MKKLLFLLFAIVLLSSCEPMAKEPKDISNIPTDVYQALKNDTVPLTMYVYEYESYTYYFNEEKEVTTVHYTGKGFIASDVILVIGFVIVVAFLIGRFIANLEIQTCAEDKQ